MNHHSTDLTDNQWQVIENFLDVQVRKRKYSLRSIVNAINYLLKTGCLWRMLPKDFPPYNLVYYYFSKWKNEGVFDELFFKLHIWLHVMLGRAKCHSLGLIDSRSVKTSHHVKTTFGVDTLGIPLAIVVHEANIHDRVGVLQVFEDMRFK